MKKVSCADVLKFIGDDGLGAEAFIKELYLSFHAAQRGIGGKIVNNLLAYGPGGYGKSTIARKFLEAMGINEYKVFDANSETSVEKLFGGMNYPAYINQGLTRYNIEDSWMNYEYVIFEEALSMPVKSITALRNLLQSGIFVNGGQEIAIKTKWIVIATNRDPSMFAGNEDMDALLSRFLYRCKVDWSHLDLSQKIEAYSKIIENEGCLNLDDQETRLLAKIFATNDGASPRLAKLITGRSDISKEFFGTTDIQTICQELGWECEGIEEMLRKDAEKAIRKVLDEQVGVINQIESYAVTSSSKKDLTTLALANSMAEKCRTAILDACATHRSVLGSDPYEAIRMIETIAEKQQVLENIAGKIALR